MLPGFNGSVSAYYTPNTTPRGAYADAGLPLGRSSLTMFDAEFRYRSAQHRVEARGEYVFVSFGNPANLRANNDTIPPITWARQCTAIRRARLPSAARQLPVDRLGAGPVLRYSFLNTQTGGFAGSDLNAPTGAGQTQFHTAGVAVFPSPQIV